MGMEIQVVQESKQPLHVVGDLMCRIPIEQNVTSHRAPNIVLGSFKTTISEIKVF